jgi:hypothetical protein
MSSEIPEESNQIPIAIVLVLFLAGMFSCLSAQTTVTGRVVGIEGEPMIDAHVSLAPPEEAKALKVVRADKNGNFAITIDVPGVWMLHFSGVGHHDHRVALYVDRPQKIELTVQLGSYVYLQEFDQAKVVGDFNRWYVLSGAQLQRQTDGMYEAEIETKADTVAYRLNGVRDGGAIEGTQADRYVYDGAGGYISVLNVRPGKVRIIFDPDKFPRSDMPANITFASASNVVSRFGAVYDEFQRYQDEYLSSQRNSLRSGKKRSEFSYDWSGALSSFEKQTNHEKIRVLRGELTLCRLAIARTAGRLDTSICASCLREITPASRVWSLDVHSLFYVLTHSGWTEEKRETYVEQTLKKNSDKRVKAALLYDLLMAAKLSSQSQLAEKYYHLLLDGYGSSPEAEQAKRHSH